MKTKTTIRKTTRSMPADMRTPCMADGPTPADMLRRALEWKADERRARPYALRETKYKPHDTWCRFFYDGMNDAVCSLLDLLTDEEFERAAFVDRMDGEKYMMLVFTPPKKEWIERWNADITSRYADSIEIIRKKLDADHKKEVADAIAERVEIMDAYAEEKIANLLVGRMRKTRTDKGKNHNHKKRPHGWKKQEDVADDFNEKAVTIEGKKRGGCCVTTIKRWDKQYPNSANTEPHCGYHAEMRTDSTLKKEYYIAVTEWGKYWKEYKSSFNKWRQTHKSNPAKDFRYRPHQTTIVDGERAERSTRSAWASAE